MKMIIDKYEQNFSVDNNVFFLKYDDGPLTPQDERNNEDEENEEQDGMDNDQNDNESFDNNLVVLDPDHPLMARFQKRLKEQLYNREQKVTLELREAKYLTEVRIRCSDGIQIC